MNPLESIIEGTLHPDGTLVLDEAPNLPPGRVKVVVAGAGAKALAFKYANTELVGAT